MLGYWAMFWKLVRFKATKEDYESFDWRSAAFGLVLITIAGIGRWWDDPTVHSMQQKMGLGSTAYSLFLSLVLAVEGWMLRIRGSTIVRWLSLLGYVAPLAFLYAIPVERIVGDQNAILLNVIFLIVVAVYRVALLAHFFRVFGELTPIHTGFATALPISALGFFIVSFGMGAQVLQAMGGLRDGESESRQAVESFVGLFGVTVTCLAPMIFVAFLVIATQRAQSLKSSIPKDEG